MGPTRAEILHKHLIHNLNLIRRAVAPAQVMAIVKANGYGHGSVEIARSALANGASWLGVAFPEEGVELRRAGIDAPILVFGAQLEEFFELHIQNNLDLTLASVDQLLPLRKICNKLHTRARVHIKLDTGMGRVGFRFEDGITPLRRILDDPLLDVVGVYSHFSSADETDLEYTRNQLLQFQQLKSEIDAYSNRKILYHFANSAAIMRLPESYFDMVRPGVMLYGNPPGPDFNLQWDLKEVMRLVSRVAQIKTVPAGSALSYNRRYHTAQATKIAIVPAGYADGYNRKLTNRGVVLIHGKRYTVSGTVCMDQFVVDLGPDSRVKVGDEVVLMGRQKEEMITNLDISRKLETIPYEITCNISARVPRVHVKG